MNNGTQLLADKTVLDSAYRSFQDRIDKSLAISDPPVHHEIF